MTPEQFQELVSSVTAAVNAIHAKSRGASFHITTFCASCCFASKWTNGDAIFYLWFS
jgi:3-oxoacyl-(acyl-carrier-protein) synthase